MALLTVLPQLASADEGTDKDLSFYVYDLGDKTFNVVPGAVLKDKKPLLGPISASDAKAVAAFIRATGAKATSLVAASAMYSDPSAQAVRCAPGWFPCSSGGCCPNGCVCVEAGYVCKGSPRCP
jgi:hypothetical protein